MHRISIEEFPSHQHTSFGVARLAQSASRTQLRRGFLLVAPRVRARHTAIPPPRGKMNLTGPSHPRQIVSGNWLCPGSRDPKPWNQRTTAVVPHPHGAARSLRCLPPQPPGDSGPTTATTGYAPGAAGADPGAARRGGYGGGTPHLPGNRIPTGKRIKKGDRRRRTRRRRRRPGIPPQRGGYGGGTPPCLGVSAGGTTVS